MLTICTLPNELLLDIFTCGCDEGDNGMHHTLSAYGNDPIISHRFRRPKMFTLSILSVCRRWSSIALTKSNSHLFEAHIGLGEVTVDIAKVIAAARSVLMTSDGCDLFVSFIPTYFIRSRRDWSDAEYETHMCLTLHLLEMLGRYHEQWRWFYLDSRLPQITSLFSDIVSRSQCFRRLGFLFTASAIDPYQRFGTLRDASSGPATPNSCRAFNRPDHPVHLAPSQFLSLTDVIMYSVENLFNMTIPIHTRTLALASFYLKSLQWQDLLWFLKQAPNLRDFILLQMVTPHRLVLGNLQTSDFQSVFLSHLRLLSLPYTTGTPEFLHHTVNKVCLKELSLNFTHQSVGDKEDLLYKMLDLPMLEELQLDSLYQWRAELLKFLLYTRMPRLKKLTICIKFSETSIHQSDPAMQLDPNFEDAPQPSPTSLTITCDKVILDEVLSKIDCSVTEKIYYMTWDFPDDAEIGQRLLYNPSITRIRFPCLTEATFGEAIFDEVTMEGGPVDHLNRSASTVDAMRQFLMHAVTPRLETVHLDDHKSNWDDSERNGEIHRLRGIWESSGSGPPLLQSLHVKLHPPPTSNSEYKLNKRLLFQLPETTYNMKASDYRLIKHLHCPPGSVPDIRGLASSQKYAGFKHLRLHLERSTNETPYYKQVVERGTESILDILVVSWGEYAGLDLQWKRTEEQEENDVWLAFEITRVEESAREIK